MAEIANKLEEQQKIEEEKAKVKKQVQLQLRNIGHIVQRYSRNFNQSSPHSLETMCYFH